MFKKHAIEMRLVKTPALADTFIDETVKPNITPEEAERLAKEMLKNFTLAAGAVLVVGAFSRGLATIAVKYAESKFNKA